MQRRHLRVADWKQSQRREGVDEHEGDGPVDVLALADALKKLRVEHIQGTETAQPGTTAHATPRRKEPTAPT
eukprot:5117887-Pleurochrysis_carterae.AAC.1